ncbi:hypothetical protein ACFL04_01970 [Patescibacteria group bacterium]
MINLKFEGPYKFVGASSSLVFTSPNINKGGIYLWVEKLGKSYVTTYVGITNRSFYERLAEHLESYLSGQYGIRTKGKDNRFTTRYKGLYGYPTDQKIKIRNNFFINYKRYSKLIDHKIHNQERLFLCPLNIPKRKLERIEGAIVKHLWEQKPPAGAAMEKIRIRPRRKLEKPFMIKIGKNNIRGLPNTILV